MPTQLAIKFAGLAAILLLAVVAVTAWRADQRDRAQLASELAATKKLLADADARQHDRDAQLTQTLAELVKEKQTITTPIQIVRELSKEIPLPAPITLQTDQNKPASRAAKESPNTNSHNSSEPTGNGLASNNQPAPAVIPQQDLKPLYDFALDCKACQAKLTAAQSDLTDEKTKTTALTHERDDALRVARGGSVWHRITRAAKWFALGAAAGAVLANAKR
jgi:hypothetical protein